jgi:hypothetical protein
MSQAAVTETNEVERRNLGKREVYKLTNMGSLLSIDSKQLSKTKPGENISVSLTFAEKRKGHGKLNKGSTMDS